MYMVNLLPWRLQRQRRRNRFWCAVYTATVLILLLVTLAGRQSIQAEQRINFLIEDADATLSAALSQRHAERTQAQQRWQQQAKRLQQRAATREWQRSLTQLAEQMPDKAWLTQLRYQQGKLALAGVAASLAALSRLDRALSQIPGFHPGTAGATTRDAQGRWQFQHQLIEDAAHAAVP
ncbi:PilN domain-containing protein [Enterobacter sp.]|uniref:PilN domain-containing protein n=1 Tax=Enterobacter sp. TaxID=42895 RepID=UPI00296EDF58|nr:PilN domain-containing protein [Enterobacter sp.]